MPNVTVRLAGGTEKENLTALTIADKRWGANGSQWGSTVSIPAGNNIQIVAHYSGQSPDVTAFNLGDEDVVIEINANGPGKTTADVTNVTNT